MLLLVRYLGRSFLNIGVVAATETCPRLDRLKPVYQWIFHAHSVRRDSEAAWTIAVPSKYQLSQRSTSRLDL